MVFTNINPFPRVMTPITNISPLTYRDASTFLEYLETIKTWLNETLVPDSNAMIDNAIEEYQTGLNGLSSYIDTAIQFVNNKTGQAEIQRTTLTDNYTVEISSLWPNNLPIDHVLTQDNIGGRVVTLGANIVGTLTVNPAPGAVTEFTLIPLGDGTWRVHQFAVTIQTIKDDLDAVEITVDGHTASIADHLTRITNAENAVVTLQGQTGALDTRATAIEADIIEQQNATTSLSGRVTAVETGKADKTTNVSSSVPLRTIAGVLRNSGAGWQLLDDAGHVPVGIDSVTSDSTTITVNYASMGVTEAGAFAVVPDEALAQGGIFAGASVALDKAVIRLGQSGGYSDFVEYVAGVGWVSSRGVFGLSFTNGVLTLTHPPIHDDTVFDLTVTGRSGPTDTFFPLVSREGANVTTTGFKVEFYNGAGVLQTANGNNMRMFVSHGSAKAIDPATVNTTTYPGSNLFVTGFMKQ